MLSNKCFFLWCCESGHTFPSTYTSFRMFQVCNMCVCNVEVTAFPNKMHLCHFLRVKKGNKFFWPAEGKRRGMFPVWYSIPPPWLYCIVCLSSKCNFISSLLSFKICKWFWQLSLSNIELCTRIRKLQNWRTFTLVSFFNVTLIWRLFKNTRSQCILTFFQLRVSKQPFKNP
jgi:hypothetical protein